MDDRTLCFQVAGWSNTRFGRVGSGLIAFEVMWWCCACRTCLARLSTVLNRLQESEVRWTMVCFPIPERLEGGQEGPSAVLVVEPKEMPERVDAYLSDLLGLQISEVVPATTA